MSEQGEIMWKAWRFYHGKGKGKENTEYLSKEICPLMNILINLKALGMNILITLKALGISCT